MNKGELRSWWLEDNGEHLKPCGGWRAGQPSSQRPMGGGRVLGSEGRLSERWASGTGPSCGSAVLVHPSLLLSSGNRLPNQALEMLVCPSGQKDIFH